MRPIRLVVLMALVLTMAGCGGSGASRFETSARQAEPVAEEGDVQAELSQLAIPQDGPGRAR